MNNEPLPVDNNKSFLKNDNKLVCGMLAFYGLCILGLVIATVWGLGRRRQIISAHATSTALAVATQHANATATAVAHVNEQAHYKIVDRFDSNAYYWGEGRIDDEYAVEEKDILGGVYVWDVPKLKQSFVSWEDFYLALPSSDYDAYVDTRIVTGPSGEVCSGLLFGESTLGFDQGAFVFMVCNNSTYYLSYHTEKEGWQNIVNRRHHDSIRADNWNRLEVSLRGTQFSLSINGDLVYKTLDDGRGKGKLALVMDVSEAPARIEFDNFGFQPR